MRADSQAVYCGTINKGDVREVVHATTDGLYARPQHRVTRYVSAWMAVEDWCDTGADAALIATEADLVQVLVRVPEAVRNGLIEGWKHVVRLRAGAREVVLGPGDWTHVDLSAETPS